MISLARHIEILLLEHDCVIVPGFGGFLTNYVEACVQCENQATLTPPCRTIGFNQSLQNNDGLLVQSYMQVYDAAYPQASKQMQLDIDEMDTELKVNGRYVLDNIGQLTIDLNHHITFKPAATTLLTPALYALPTLDIVSTEQAEKDATIQQALQQTTETKLVTTLATMGKPRTEQVTAEEAETESDTAGRTIAIQRRWVDIAISAAAAVVLFFALSYSSLQQKPISTPTVVSSASIKAPAATPAPAKVPAAEPRPSVVPSDSIKEEAAPADSVSIAKETNENATTFSIVLASGVKKSYAEDFIRKLRTKDLKEARLINDGEMDRVVYGTYTSRDAAKEALQQFRQQTSEFEDSWVIELNEAADQ